MKHSFLLIFLVLTVASCQFFETEKVSSETIFKEEINTIDWKDVDRYPSFSNCENELEKPHQKDCFINTISSQLYKSINHEGIIASRDIYDTVRVNFQVSSAGELTIVNIKMDSLLQREFPKLEAWILESVDSLRPVAPAFKRGIPVRTQFTLPVIIKTN
ncbi:hypothetical protein [Aequorivita sediminis]|uniref:hypothetical protein n=1 Tax=Aequorivita sediminis TaxID=3073653 RepID=UPI0028AAFD59|nr:hypothetical protein [Aequorivita sp. F6058]